MIAQILADSAQSDRVVIVSLVAGHVLTLGTIAVKAWIDQRNRDRDAQKAKDREAADLARREADRLDAQSKASGVMAALEAQEKKIRLEALEREARIVAKIDENTTINVQALEAANGVNAKIEMHAATTAKATEAIAAATEKVAAAQAEK